MRLLIAIALLFGLAACASVSREECLAGNWEEIGFRDGTNGQFSSYIQQHVKACQKVEVTPDPVAWERGRQRGLPAYCVPQKAYQVGRSGWSIREVCPAAQMPALRAANEKGKRYHEIEDEIRQIRTQIDQSQRLLIAEENPAVRAALVREQRSLNREINLLQLRQRPFASL